jgi:lipopolysaccharide export system permease protein
VSATTAGCRTDPEDDHLRTLDRYVFREVALTWIAVTGVLLVILVSNQLARVLSQAAVNEFPRTVVFALIGLTSVGFLTVIVPIGFFLAIVLALGRLYHESEMAALQACGVGPAGLFRPITVLGVIIVALLVWLTFITIPAATARAETIRAEALREAQFGALEPGRFRTFGGGNIVFYAERVDANGILHNVNVFIDHARSKAEQPATSNGAVNKGNTNVQPAAAATQDAGNRLEIWVATRAEQRGAGQAEQTFVLYDGYRYEGVPGEGAFRVIRFSEGGIPVRLGAIGGAAKKVEMKPTAELLSSARREDIAELQWRISTPVSAVVLMLLAVPLARLRPREGRFGKIGVAILVYFLYSRLLVSGRTWIDMSVMPTSIGLWWVHAIALCASVWLLLRESPPGRARLVAAGA